MYKKRDGTSGIRGQLYETKLISLIHFRAKFDDSLKDYHLATNVADIGTFDDICFKTKVKINGRYKPLAVFIQAKHREGENKVLTINSKNELAKWFTSYFTIRRNFTPNSKDIIFKGKFDETECVFIMYTTAKDDLNNVKYDNEFAPKLNSLVGTGNDGVRPCYKNEHVVFICDIIMKEQFSALAKLLAKFLLEEGDPILSMNDDLVLLYHVILVKKVIDVSEIRYKNEEEEHRVASFRTDFFDNVDEFVVLFRETLYNDLLKKSTLEETERSSLLATLIDKPLEVSFEVLSKLIISVVTYDNVKGKLEFVSKSTPEDMKRKLEKVRVQQSTVFEAIDSAARSKLKSRQFRVPAALGNKDLTIRGKVDVDIEGILDNLKDKFVDLVKGSQEDNVVGINDSLGEEVLKLNGGIAGIVGNLLIADENTKFLKFTNNSESLGDLSIRLYKKLSSEIKNLHDFRFNVQVKTLPKLTFHNVDEDLEILREEVIRLGRLLGEFLRKEENTIMPMDDILVLRYHVILAQKVFDITPIQYRNEDEEHRVASFQKAFFENEEEFLILIKKALYSEIIKARKIDDNDKDSLITTFLNEQSDVTILSKVIGIFITYSNGKFEFIDNENISEESKQILDKVSVPPATVDEAIEIAAKEILKPRHFKVPAAFGNKDLTITVSKGIKIERRLNHLKLKISELITNSNANKVINLDESLGDGLLKLSGGIAGIVGNLLVSDKDTTLMKFTENWESLEDLSKRLFMKLQNEIQNLHEYKFDAKVKKFPKLSFKRDDDDEKLAKDFLNKLLFYTNQADQSGVECFLKNEIEDHESHQVKNVRVTADAVFLQYHDLIQDWWLQPKEADYLTKQSNHYEKALTLIIDKPLLTIMSLIYMIKIKNNVVYTFNEEAINALKMNDRTEATIFITENNNLTVAKLVQSLKHNDRYVLDLEYILDLPANEYNTIYNELAKKDDEESNETKKTKKIVSNKPKKLEQKKTFIIVCKNLNRNWFKRLENIATILNDKPIFIVTNQALVDTIKTYFKRADTVVKDAKNNLDHMSTESQKIILENAIVKFSEVEIGLGSIIDETSMGFVEGDVLNSILNNEPIILGQTLKYHNYDKLKHLYIDRRVIRVDNLRPNVRNTNAGSVLLSLNDITNVVLLTAKPGMGKSTLLTHLSLKTKQTDPKVWIVRINLLQHSEKFSKWQTNKTKLDVIEALKFICEVVVTDKNIDDLSIDLEETNDDFYLKSCTGDDFIDFELKMFLDYYNRKELIILLDGFDEICPTYAEEVISLLKIMKGCLRNHKVWITSRPYDKVVSTLESEFGTSYEMQHFSRSEQDTYLFNYWKSKIILRNFNNDQYENLCNFMEFMSKHYYIFDWNNQKRISTVKREKHQMLFMKVCLNFLSYLRKHINVCPMSVIDTFNELFANCNYTVFFLEEFDTPLHVYLIADYFQNQMKDTTQIEDRWNLDINVFTIYDKFIETKLKKIRFQEKNKIDLYNPDNIFIYENIRADFFDKHRKLGAYAVFNKDAEEIFDVKDLREIKDIIDKIKRGVEKTGLIHNVTNGIPTFIHMTFTEYFAVEFISELIKTETRIEKVKSTWNFILNTIFFKCRENVRVVLGYKIQSDELIKAKVYEHEDIIFELLLEQGKGVFTHYPNDFSKELYLKIKLPLKDAMADDLSNFIPLLFKLKEKLSVDYLKDVTRCTPRIKRLKFMNLLQKKRKALETINSAQIHDEEESMGLPGLQNEEPCFNDGEHRDI